MEDPCSSVAMLLEKYFDREATPQERTLVEAHLRGCSSCQDTLKSMEELRGLLAIPVEDQAREEDFGWVFMKVKRELRSEEGRPWKEIFHSRLISRALLQKRVWIPAFATALILLLALTSFFFKKGSSYPIPTVVEYIESDTSNVMIYESEKGNVTVIWVIEDTETAA